MQIQNIIIYKHLEVSTAVLGNIIVDGLLGYNYSFARAQNIAEEIIAGKSYYDGKKDIYISSRALQEAIKKYCASNTDIEIEMVSEATEELFNIMKEEALRI